MLIDILYIFDFLFKVCFSDGEGGIFFCFFTDGIDFCDVSGF